jgi:uncharacterized peroxidase-related enzyme
MAFIDTGNDHAGIRGLMEFRPETSNPLLELAEILLRKPSTMEAWERELIATYVSHRNQCKFCCNSHGALVNVLREGEVDVVAQVKEDIWTAEISDKLKALLHIAAKVQEAAYTVTKEDIVKAREAGATDTEIHDGVLIAAAFCMYNRYVDGLGSKEWDDPNMYDTRAEITAFEGYFAPTD